MYTGIKLDTSALQTPTLAQKLSLKQKTSPSSYEQAQAEAEKAEYERRMLEARRKAAQEQLEREKRIIAEQEAAQAEYERRMLQARQQAQREQDARQARQTQMDLTSSNAAQTSTVERYRVVQARYVDLPTGGYFVIANVEGPWGCRAILVPEREYLISVGTNDGRGDARRYAEDGIQEAAEDNGLVVDYGSAGRSPSAIFSESVAHLHATNPQAFFEIPGCTLPSDEELLEALGLGGQQAPTQQAPTQSPAQQAPAPPRQPAAQQGPSKLPAFLAVGAAAALMYIIGSMA